MTRVLHLEAVSLTVQHRHHTGQNLAAPAVVMFVRFADHIEIIDANTRRFQVRVTVFAGKTNPGVVDIDDGTMFIDHRDGRLQ